MTAKRRKAGKIGKISWNKTQNESYRIKQLRKNESQYNQRENNAHTDIHDDLLSSVTLQAVSKQKAGPVSVRLATSLSTSLKNKDTYLEEKIHSIDRR